MSFSQSVRTLQDSFRSLNFVYQEREERGPSFKTDEDGHQTSEPSIFFSKTEFLKDCRDTPEKVRFKSLSSQSFGRTSVVYGEDGASIFDHY